MSKLKDDRHRSVSLRVILDYLYADVGWALSSQNVSFISAARHDADVVIANELIANELIANELIANEL